MTLTLTALVEIPSIQQADFLPDIILAAAAQTGVEVRDNDIFVLAQKIVSKSEGRTVHLQDVVPSARAIRLGEETEKDPRLVELILQESREVVRSRPGLIIVEHNLGFVCANAGIDQSNVVDSELLSRVLLLPINPDQSARDIRAAIFRSTGAEVGVLIIDSHGRAWRNGIVGLTIGTAGVPGVVDKRGDLDLYGRELHVTTIGAADELAAGASLLMGQADEGTPVIHVRGFPYALRESGLSELIRSKELDMFR